MVDDTDFESFVTFARGLKPDLDASLRGATWPEISALERVARVSLPDMVRRLLFAMGHGDGGMNLGIEHSLDVTDLINYYQEETQSTESDGRLCPPGYLVLAARDGDHDVCVRVSGGSDVILASGESCSVPYADSLAGLLYRDAFIAFGVEARPHRGYLAGREGHPGPSLREVGDVAEKLEYVSDWYSDTNVSCLRSSRGSMMTLTLCEGGTIGVSVGARTRREVLRVWWEFRQAFGFELVGWH